MKNQVRIAVRGADLVARERLVIVQDELKVLHDEKFIQLRDEIIEQGFSYCVHVWDDGVSLNVLDGTQRLRTLERLVTEGRRVILPDGSVFHEEWECPQIPISYVDATDIKHAIQKLLAGASSYGEPSDEGLHDLMVKYNITLPDIKNVSLYNIQLPDFSSTFFPGINPTTGDAEVVNDSDADEVPEPPKVAKTKRGELWLLGPYYECESCQKKYEYLSGSQMTECPCG
jgi:hypothetical protein